MKKLLIILMTFFMFTSANAGVCDTEFLKIKDVVASLYTKMIYKNPTTVDFVAVKKQLNPKFTTIKKHNTILCIGETKVKNIDYIIEFKVISNDLEYTSVVTYPKSAENK